jgi:hypothetical protein
MDIRLFNIEQDYAEVSTWWEAQGWPPVKASWLSTTGYIVTDGDRKLAAGWLYLTNSKAAVFEWMVGNPEASIEDRAEAQDLILRAVDELAQSMDLEMVFTNTDHDKLMERLVKHKYIITDKGMTNLVRLI